MKTIHDDPAVKAAQATLDTVHGTLADVQAEYQRAFLRWHSQHRGGETVNSGAAADEITRLLQGPRESDFQTMHRLEAREKELVRASELAREELNIRAADAGQALRRELEPEAIALRKTTLRALTMLVEAIDAEDRQLEKLVSVGAFVGDGPATFLGYMPGGLTGRSAKDLLREETKALMRREVASDFSTTGGVRIRLLSDACIDGEWFQLDSVLDLPHKPATLLILDGLAEQTKKAVNAKRGKSPGQVGLQLATVWG